MYNRNSNRGGRDVCKFFLEGRCKFGDNCKNEHPSGGGGGGGFQSNANRFAPLQNPSGGNARGRSGAVSGVGGQGQVPEPYGVTADNIRLDLTDNSQKGERPQWEFSAYAPGVGAPRQLIEGPVEQSEEEMRVMCYLAKATGQLQAYDQHVNGLRNEMNQQIQRILSDAEGAKKYVQEGEHQHPNRLDLVRKSNQDFPWANKPSSQPQAGNTLGQANAVPSGFGQQRPAVPGFGAPSSLGGVSSFGKPSALGGGGGGVSGFGQPSPLGAKPGFTQPAFSSQPATSGFGQPSQPGAGVFGQPPQPAANGFGQPPQPAATSLSSQPAAPGFGQPPQPATINFGKPSQPTANPFAQPPQPAANGFGQPPTPASNPFSQAAQQAAPGGFGKPSVFGGGGAAAAATPQFGASGFGQQPTKPGFGQGPQPALSGFGQNTQQQAPSGFAAAATQPLGFAAAANRPSGFGAASNQQAVAGNGMFHGQRIYKHPKNGYPVIKEIKDGVERETRVWFPDGPPPPPAKVSDTEGIASEYEGEKGALLKAAYDFVRENGKFHENLVPECPPKNEWISFDL